MSTKYYGQGVGQYNVYAAFPTDVPIPPPGMCPGLDASWTPPPCPPKTSAVGGADSKTKCVQCKPDAGCALTSTNPMCPLGKKAVVYGNYTCCETDTKKLLVGAGIVAGLLWLFK